MINLWLFSLLELCLVEGIAFYLKKYLLKKLTISYQQQLSIWLAALVLLCIFLIFERNISYVYVATCMLLTGAGCQATTTYIAQEKQWSKIKYWLALAAHCSLLYLLIKLSYVLSAHIHNTNDLNLLSKNYLLSNYPLGIYSTRTFIEGFSVTALIYCMFYLTGILTIKTKNKIKCLWYWGIALAISLCIAIIALPLFHLKEMLRHSAGI